MCVASPGSNERPLRASVRGAGRCYKSCRSDMTLAPFRRPFRRTPGCSWRSAVAFAFALVMVLAQGPSARAQAERPERRALIEQGKAQRLAGDEAEALASFERAHRMAASPETLGLM